MRSAAVAALVCVVAIVSAPSAAAQAWVASAGQGSITVAVQGIHHTGHVQTDGSTIPGGESRTASIYLEADYAITDRLSIAVGVPFVFAKFLGPAPPYVPVQDVDSCGCWTRSLQDVGLTARFNLLNGSTAVTPSVSFGVPSHAYQYAGEAVVGRRLRELRVGLDAGTRLDVISPRLALQGSYAYAMVERVLGVSTNRSNASIEALFRLTDAAAIRGGVTRQVTHGGLRFGTEGPSPPNGVPWGEVTTPELLSEHDRLVRDNNWRLGAGLTYGLPRADVFVSYVEFVAGSDTHAGRALTVGLNIPFER